jgi:hypothetical protein
MSEAVLFREHEVEEVEDWPECVDQLGKSTLLLGIQGGAVRPSRALLGGARSDGGDRRRDPGALPYA